MNYISTFAYKAPERNTSVKFRTRALTALSLALFPWTVQAACSFDLSSGSSATGGSNTCLAAQPNYSLAAGPLLNSSGLGSLLSVMTSATTITPSEATGGLNASAGGSIFAAGGKLTIDTNSITDTFIAPVISRDANSTITINNIDATNTGGSSTSVLGARDTGTIIVKGIANIHISNGDFNSAIDAQNSTAGNSRIELGTSTLVTHIGLDGGFGGGAVVAESSGGGPGALVKANGPLTIRTDSVMGILATAGNEVNVEGVDIQTGVTVTAPFTANKTPSGKKNAFGQGIIGIGSDAAAATITFKGGIVTSTIRRGIEARGNSQITSNGNTTVTVTANGATASDLTAGQAAVLVKGATARYTNNGTLTILSQGSQSDGITVNQGSVNISDALQVDISGIPGAPASATSLCSTGAGICLEGNNANFSANPNGTLGSGHISSSGYAFQMSPGINQGATIGGTTFSTNGNQELISIQGSTGNFNLTNSIAKAGINGIALAATGSSAITFTNYGTQITGDVISGSGSTVQMALNNGSKLAGVITAVKTTIDTTSIWAVRASSVPALLNNAGAIRYPVPTSNAFTTVKSSTDYGSLGGSVIFNTQLGNSNSPTDQLIVQQNVVLTKPTILSILNAGGSGAITTGDGILIVQVLGASPASAFALANPVIVGAYTYELVQVGNNWYLQSKLTPLVPPTIAGTPPNGVVGTVYSGFIPTLGPTNVTLPVTLTMSAGSLPPGLSIDLTTGAITGTPTKVGTYTLTITSTNAAGSVDLPITIIITQPQPPVSTTPVPSLSGWGLMLLVTAMAGLGRWRLRTRT